MFSLAGAYLLMLLVLWLGSYYPEGRVWGFNWWAYYPSWFPSCMLGLGVLIGGGVLQANFKRSLYGSGLSERDSEKVSANSTRYYAFTGVMIILYTPLFVILRARTHFLGDGYGLLSLLGNDSPIMSQVREMGESLLHIWMKQVFSIEGQEGALLSYQVLSIASGVIMV